MSRANSRRSVPFNPARVHHRQLLLLNSAADSAADSAANSADSDDDSADSADSADSEKKKGGSRVRPRSKSKSKMMKRKRTTLKRKPPK